MTDTSYLRSIREQVVQRHIAAEEDGDVAAVLRTFAPGRVSYSGDTLGGDLIGDQAVGAMLTAGLAAMSDLKIEILRLHHAEDAVITELRLASTHTADFDGIPATAGVSPTTCARYFASMARTCGKKPSTTTSPR